LVRRRLAKFIDGFEFLKTEASHTSNENGNQPHIYLQIPNPAQLPYAHLSFLALLGGRLIRYIRRIRLPSRDPLRRNDWRPRHWGKLQGLECRHL
jgi:hypothetical protein